MAKKDKKSDTAKAKSRRREAEPDEDEDEEEEAPRRRRSSSKSGGSVKIDMREANTGGGRVRLPEGDYKVKIVKAEKGLTRDGDKTQLIVSYEILDGPGKTKGKTLKDYMTITAKSAYRVGQLLDACGIKWSAKIIELPLNKLKGKELGITVHDGDPYKGKIKSEIGDWLDAETIDGILEGEDDEDEDDDEDDDEDEDEDDDEDEDLDEFDDDDEL